MLESLEDFSWSLLEKLNLAEFFEDRNIPPIMFPLGILVVIVLIALLLMQGTGGGLPTQSPCGDEVCDSTIGEDIISCPKDCADGGGKDTSTVIIELVGKVTGKLEVRLEDVNRDLIRSDQGSSNKFTFAGVSADTVIASVRNPDNSRVVESEFVKVDSKTVTITLALPPDFFEEDNVARGTLRVVLKDAQTNMPTSGKVTVMMSNDKAYTRVGSQDVNGAGYFTLEANQWYSVLVEAEGFETYDGRDDPVKLEANKERQIDVVLERLPFGITSDMSSLRVCAVDQKNMPLTGQAKVITVSGTHLGSAELDAGCADFEELPPASAVVASVNQIPDNCIPASSEMTLEIGNNLLVLNVTCLVDALPGKARVRVMGEDNDTVLTYLATITAWDENGTQLMGSGVAGALVALEEFTEYILVAPMVPFYFIVTNLEGYATHTSQQFTVGDGELKSITLTLESSAEPTFEFTFMGVSVPSPVVVGSEFTVSVSKILYGQTDVTASANVSIEVAAESCTPIQGGGASATCIAPSEPGEYDVSISATYNDEEGTAVEQVDVVGSGPSYYLEVFPHTILDTEPPIEIAFDIYFNDSPLDSLTDSEVSVYYEDGGVWLPDHPGIQGSDGTYYVTVDTDFPGDHSLELYLMKLENNIAYEQNYSISFEAIISNLGAITFENSIDPLILEPDENFDTYVRLTSDGEEVAGLNNVYATITDQKSNLGWDSSLHVYTETFSAPSYEGIFPITYELEDEEIGEDEFYVVDTSLQRYEECEIDECEDRLMVRACVYEHRYGGLYEESEVISCILGGMGGDYDITHCLDSSADRGDWDNDCGLSSTDVDNMESFLERVPNEESRNLYAGCGDMDNDGDVDESDLTCLTNVVAGSWFGDIGGSCDERMMGGVCAQIDLGIPGDFNDDDNWDSTDLGIMDVVVNAASDGVTISDALLNVSDFDWNGRIQSTDRNCLDSIVSGGTISLGCLEVFNFGCHKVPGDLTQDGAVDASDMALERWILDGRVDYSNVFTCADVTQDGSLTEGDFDCIRALVHQDDDEIGEFCPYCYFENQKLSRYGLEICHDGLDNDCNNEIDEDCDCDEDQSCSKLYDSDGDPTTNDFMLCRSFGHRGYFGSEGDLSSGEDSTGLESEGSYDWYPIEDIEGACSGADDWGRTQHCGGGSATCLFKFEPGFTCGSSGETFMWEFAEGVIGPLCNKFDCHDRPDCPGDWVKIDEDEGGTCNLFYEEKCTYCRFQYDNCKSSSCGTEPPSCDDGVEDDSESCPTESCMGLMGSTPKGDGYYDNRYGLYLLWKPISESTGNAYALVPDEYHSRISRVYVSGDPNGDYYVETADSRDAELAGGWIYDFSQPGLYYGACYLIVEFSGVDQSQRPYITVPYGENYGDDYRVVWHFPTAAARYSNH